MMPSEPASARPCNTALRVCEDETLKAGKAKPLALAVSSISAYCSGVAMGMKAPSEDGGLGRVYRLAEGCSGVADVSHRPRQDGRMLQLRLAELGIAPLLLRATRAAALAAAEFTGGGDRDAVDGAAVAALRAALAEMPVDGRVVVGEGEKDAAPMLQLGERFGSGSGPAIDVAVDPVDGTSLAAAGAPGAMAVMAVAPRGAFLDIGPAHYMDKLVSRVAGLRL